MLNFDRVPAAVQEQDDLEHRLIVREDGWERLWSLLTIPRSF